MNNVYFYFHAGSANHGCEAIVRSTQAMLNVRPILFSGSPEQDRDYGLDAVCEIKGKERYRMSFAEKVGCVVTSKLLRSEAYGYDVTSTHESMAFEGNSVALSIGGDNYCYGTAYNQHLAGLNRSLHRRGVKTVLWGCSINPETVTAAMRRDFARYDLIVARESLSYQILKDCNPNTIIACDPAFTLKMERLPLPDTFIEGKTVGINISPMIQKNETVSGITLKNYIAMIEYILENTDYQIALIPHVVIADNDDRKPIQQLYEMFKASGRICLINDCNCLQLKGFISRCALFIGARTHATIAAYSTCVPTLVVGYSTKAKGIATDLFGTAEHYVLPVQQLRTEKDMFEAFIWLNTNRERIQQHLQEQLTKYTRTAQTAANYVKDLL